MSEAERATERLEATGEWVRIEQGEFVPDDDHIFFDPRCNDFRYASFGLPRTEEDMKLGRETSLSFVCMKYIGTALRRHPDSAKD